MAEGEEEEPTYTLETPDGILHRSRNYTGYGKAKYENGDVYAGEYTDGMREGRGKYTFRNEDVYDGEFELNLKNGIGTSTYSSKTGDEEGEDDGDGPKRGGKYHGSFSKGARKGDGTFTYLNGDVYCGEWHDGKKHGKGTYAYATDGTKLIGEWKNGKIDSGRWVFPNGMYYIGKFAYNKPTGQGTWVFPGGHQLNGEFVQKLEFDEDAAPAEGEEQEVEKVPTKVDVAWRGGRCVMVRG